MERTRETDRVNFSNKQAGFIFVLLTLIIAVGLIISLFPKVLADGTVTPTGSLLTTNPTMLSTGTVYSSKGNYMMIDVYGWQMDPRVETDSSHDYYFFTIWCTTGSTSGWYPNSGGINDAHGATMYVTAGISSPSSFMDAYTTPSGDVKVGTAGTWSANFGFSYGGASIGLGWSQNVPIWECQTTLLTPTQINWIAADSSGNHNQVAYQWAFTVGVMVPEGQGFCSLVISMTCNWFQNVILFPQSDSLSYFNGGTYNGYTLNSVNPNGGQLNVDGNTITSPTNYAWGYQTSHTMTPVSPYSTGSGSQKVFTSWSDGSTASPRSVTVTGNGAYTANWKNQYYLTVNSPYSTPYGGGWYDSGNTAYASVTSGVVSGGTGVEYAFSSWSGDASGTNYARSGAITMNAPKTATANWYTLYSLTVKSYPSGIDNPSPSGWYQSGSNVGIQCSTPVSGGTGVQYVFTSWSGDASGSSPATSINMYGPRTAIANYKTQYYLTVNSAYGSPIGTGWYDSGATASASLSSGTVSGGSGVQYVFTGWGGDASGTGLTSNAITMNGPETATANWKTQYYLTMGANFGTTSPANGWYDADSVVTISATAPSFGSGEQYVWNGWTGSGSGSYTGTSNPATNAVTMSAPITETASWTHQYQVSFAVSPSGSGTTTPSGTSVWENAGSLPISATPNSGYSFSSWTSTGSITFSNSNLASTTATISGTGTITANFAGSTVSVTFGVSGMGSDTGSATVLTIDSTSYTYAQLPQPFTWTTNSLHSVVASTPVAAGTGKEYTFSSWTSGDGLSGPSGTYIASSSGTVTCNYQTYYYLTTSTNYGSVSPASGWMIGGSTVTISASAPSVGSGEQYVWIGWTGTGAGSYTGTSNPGTNAVTMSAPITETGSWTHQYQVSFAVSPSGAGATTPSGTSVWENAGSLSISATPNSGYSFSSWTTSGSITVTTLSSSSTTATISGSGTIIANFELLSVTISPSSPIIDVGQSQLFTSNVSGGSSPYTYQWYLNGSAVQNATSSSWTFTPSSAGYYTVYVRATDSASTSVTVQSINALATVNSVPGTHDVAVTNVACSKTVVCQGFNVNINVTVANQGDYTETCNITAYANATIIGSENVTLSAGNSTTVTFTWNTTGFAYGNYTISAYALLVPGETNMGSNKMTGGTVYVGIPGDINGDGTVDIYDAIILAGCFGSSPGSRNWNLNADLNGDGIVDIYDAIIMSSYFGQQIS